MRKQQVLTVAGPVLIPQLFQAEDCRQGQYGIADAVRQDNINFFTGHAELSCCKKRLWIHRRPDFSIGP
jgi:hypothetical protein